MCATYRRLTAVALSGASTHLLPGNPAQKGRNSCNSLYKTSSSSSVQGQTVQSFYHLFCHVVQGHGNPGQRLFLSHLFCFDLGEVAGGPATQLCKMFLSMHLALILPLFQMGVTPYTSAPLTWEHSVQVRGLNTRST